MHLDLEKQEADKAKPAADPSAQTTASVSAKPEKAPLAKVLDNELEEGEFEEKAKDAEKNVKEFMHGQPTEEDA